MVKKSYSVKEIANIENVTAQTVYAWCSNGYLNHSRRPTRKGKGRIIIKGEFYAYFKEAYKI